MKNLGDLNNYLFEQLDRLNEVDEDNMSKEINRARAISEVASKVIDNGRLVLDAEKYKDDKWDADATVPGMLEG